MIAPSYSMRITITVARELLLPGAGDPALLHAVITTLLHASLKVHKIENFFGSNFEFCVISLLVMIKY
jgi:hypothetical protein